MQILYAIITILVIVAIFIIMFFAFKKDGPSNSDGSSKGFKIVPHPTSKSQSNECVIYFNESLNHTITGTELKVNVRNMLSDEEADSTIYNTAHLKSEKGATIGNGPDFEYRMQSRYISTHGAFKIFKNNGKYYLACRKNSSNKFEVGNKELTVIEFEEFTTFRFGDLVFTFSVPGYKSNADVDQKSYIDTDDYYSIKDIQLQSKTESNDEDDFVTVTIRR